MFGFNFWSKSSTNISPENNAHLDRVIFVSKPTQIPPTYVEWDPSQNIVQEELTPSHPLYYELFPEEQVSYPTYLTTENDTLTGIAMKLEISESKLRDINSVSGEIYPGMKLKLPTGCDPQSLKQVTNNKIVKEKAGEVLGSIFVGQSNKFTVEYYTGLMGYIYGTLTISANYVIFNPSLDHPENTKRFPIQKLLRFNLIVDMHDLQDVMGLQIPDIADDTDKDFAIGSELSQKDPLTNSRADSAMMVEDLEQSKPIYRIYHTAGPQIKQKGNEQMASTNPVNMPNFAATAPLQFKRVDSFKDQQFVKPKQKLLLQLSLYRVGSTKLENKYREKLLELRAQQKPIASVSFGLGYDSNPKELEDHGMALSLLLKMLQAYRILGTVSDDSKRLTKVPYFDIISSNIKTKKDPQVHNHIISKSALFGELIGQSQIITPTQYAHLAHDLPLIYQLQSWGRVYEPSTDGRLFKTFLNRGRLISPLLLLCKQENGNSFGAFCVESFQNGKTGSGQMFIFTFRENSDIPEIYTWTKTNSFFVNIQPQLGIGVGMGTSYAFFIRSTLDRGSSGASDTFGNKGPLTTKPDFHLETVELWGIDRTSE